MRNRIQSGYCHHCVRNLPHLRQVRTVGLKQVDLLIGNMLGAVGLGPWYCTFCGSRSLLLAAPRQAEEPHQAEETDVRFPGADLELEANGGDRPSLPVKRRANGSGHVADGDRVDKPVGNFLKTDKSLIQRSRRILRFSQKYRDSIVDRVLFGTTTISELRRERELGEAELIDWIADKVRRQERELIHLRKAAGDLPPIMTILPASKNSSTRPRRSSRSSS